MTNRILTAFIVPVLILTAYGTDSTNAPQPSTGNGDAPNEALSRLKATRLPHNISSGD